MFEKMPKRIANFEIIRELGRGGMGCVYLAKQMKQTPGGNEEALRDIALKVLPTPTTSNLKELKEYNEAKERFEAEVRAVSLLESDNIVRLYDSGFADNVQFLAMQFIDGPSLFEIIQKYKKQMPIDKIVVYTKQICRGLIYAHNKDIIHRDIKPQNILVSKESDKCHIADFGIARIKREGRLTMVGMAVGTPEYMSPEQASGKVLDQQTDIYSLGILIYEMCTGNPPFYGNDPVSVAYQQVHEEPKKPSKIRHDIPVRLENIIMKALKKSKHERYKTIFGILKDLDALEKEESSNVSAGFKEYRTPPVDMINSYYGRQKSNARTTHTSKPRRTRVTKAGQLLRNKLMPIIIMLSILLGFALAVIIMLILQTGGVIH